MKYLQLTLFLLTLLIILVNAGPVKREAETEYKPYCYYNYKDYKKYCPYKHHPYKREAAKAIAESDSSDVVTEGAASYQFHDRGYKNDHHGHHDHHDYHHGHHGHHD
ncbi:unnamed protein product [Rhizophagus irregularis]|nr:unnamed protein product [Rhizophagus irregularis]CAB4408536.1 unnamed protein product [Rhizophagus irregularis]